MFSFERLNSAPFGLVMALSLLGGCGERAATPQDLAGHWEFRSRGGRAIAIPEEKRGTVILRSDGTFNVANVSGTVLKRTDNDARRATGHWEVEEQPPPFEPFGRTILEMRYDDQGAPFRAYVSGRYDSQTMTFVRDEEAGEWVKFRKVPAQ